MTDLLSFCAGSFIGLLIAFTIAILSDR